MEQGDDPSERGYGRGTVAVKLLPDRAVKFRAADSQGLDELARSLDFERLGFGPRVIDAYLCRSGELVAIVYERLDGSLNDVARHFGDTYPTVYRQAHRAALALEQQARAAGLLHGDAHPGNFMFKVLPDGTWRWYMIDHGEARRIAPASVGQSKRLSPNHKTFKFKDNSAIGSYVYRPPLRTASDPFAKVADIRVRKEYVKHILTQVPPKPTVRYSYHEA